MHQFQSIQAKQTEEDAESGQPSREAEKGDTLNTETEIMGDSPSGNQLEKTSLKLKIGRTRTKTPKLRRSHRNCDSRAADCASGKMKDKKRRLLTLPKPGLRYQRHMPSLSRQ